MQFLFRSHTSGDCLTGMLTHTCFYMYFAKYLTKRHTLVYQTTVVQCREAPHSSRRASSRCVSEALSRGQSGQGVKLTTHLKQGQIHDCHFPTYSVINKSFLHPNATEGTKSPYLSPQQTVETYKGDNRLTVGGKLVRHTHRSPLYTPEIIFLCLQYSFLLEAV
jgi:hypothetical protein